MSNKPHIKTTVKAHGIVKREVIRRNKVAVKTGEPIHTMESVSHEIITEWDGKKK